MLSKALSRDFMAYLSEALASLKAHIEAGFPAAECLVAFDDEMDAALHLMEHRHHLRSDDHEWVSFSLTMTAMVASFCRLAVSNKKEATAVLELLSALLPLQAAKAVSHE